MTYYYVNRAYLQHHGIKGQHWGIRRYQNKDGSLTSEGIKRYKTVENFNKERQQKRERNIAIAKRIGKAALVGTAAVAGRMVVKSALVGILGNASFHLPKPGENLGLTFPGTDPSHGPRPWRPPKGRDSLLNTLMEYFAGTDQISPATSGDMFTQMLSGKPHHASLSNVVINRRGQ